MKINLNVFFIHVRGGVKVEGGGGAQAGALCSVGREGGDDGVTLTTISCYRNQAGGVDKMWRVGTKAE